MPPPHPGSSDRYLAAALQVLEPTLVTTDAGGAGARRDCDAGEPGGPPGGPSRYELLGLRVQWGDFTQNSVNECNGDVTSTVTGNPVHFYLTR